MPRRFDPVVGVELVFRVSVEKKDTVPRLDTIRRRQVQQTRAYRNEKATDNVRETRCVVSFAVSLGISKRDLTNNFRSVRYVYKTVAFRTLLRPRYKRRRFRFYRN